MLFANHLAVSFRATTLATAYRALTVAQACTDRSAAQHTAAFFCWAGSWTTYGLPHLCTSAYRALTVAQAQIFLLPSTLLPCLLVGVVDYGLPHLRT